MVVYDSYIGTKKLFRGGAIKYETMKPSLQRHYYKYV